ncbi:endonuclease/exonuclease/phosphatase family protein [Demequina soli]|uniref:endonuclease/exonuclease/phosphatase family protein n=1 Tax=Demequina soli TaxID=1638987 RepID=UPI000782E349|nr:endonuclease/exonuclease/phosphatase family protein [Demequina soli]
MGEPGDDARVGSVPSASRAAVRVLTVLARIGAALALAAVLVPVAARLTGWEAGPLAILVSLMPWVTLLAFVPVVLALVGRAWVLLAAAVAVAGLCVAWMAPLFVASPTVGEPVLRVGQLSLANGSADADAVVALVRDSDLDMLSVTELTPSIHPALAAAGLDDLLPYSAAYPDDFKYGTGLWSRYPITSAETLPGLSATTVRAEVDTPVGALTVVVAHPESPGFRDHELWDQDLVALTGLLERETGPMLLMGDLNTTRDHRAFRDLEGMGFVDAADEAGAGFQATYPEWPGMYGSTSRLDLPLVAIDHVLARDLGLRASALATVIVPRTDHRGVLVEYARP